MEHQRVRDRHIQKDEPDPDRAPASCLLGTVPQLPKGSGHRRQDDEIPRLHGAAELVALRPCDLQLIKPFHLRLSGKGQKERICPLWPQTAELLHKQSIGGALRADEVNTTKRG